MCQRLLAGQSSVLLLLGFMHEMQLTGMTDILSLHPCLIPVLDAAALLANSFDLLSKGSTT